MLGLSKIGNLKKITKTKIDMVTPLVTVILHYFLRIESKENVFSYPSTIFSCYIKYPPISLIYIPASTYGGTWTLTHTESTHKLHKIL